MSFGNFAKQFQRADASADDLESISKARHDKDGVAAHTVFNPYDRCVTDERYNSWLNDHPSALRCFNGMMSSGKGKRIVVFLDYDGTLSPIVNDPNRAFMSQKMRSAVREVARRFPTAIISGRSRDKVYKFVKLDDVYYAGSHGMDIRGPPPPPQQRQQQEVEVKSYDGKYQNRVLDKEGNEFIIYQPAQKFLPAIEEMLKELETKTKGIEGAEIEDNSFCISVHYRRVHESDYKLLREIVQSVLAKNQSRFHMTEGKMVMEIRPSINWNKGHALEYLLDTLGCGSSDDVLPIYIGDDRTDEDAFKVLKSKGLGYPIIVSTVQRETMASYSLRDPSEVLSFLKRLARLRENSSYYQEKEEEEKEEDWTAFFFLPRLIRLCLYEVRTIFRGFVRSTICRGIG